MTHSMLRPESGRERSEVLALTRLVTVKVYCGQACNLLERCPEWVPEGLGTAQVARGGDASASLTAVSLQPSKLARCGKGAQLLSQPLRCLLQ